MSHGGVAEGAHRSVRCPAGNPLRHPAAVSLPLPGRI